MRGLKIKSVPREHTPGDDSFCQYNYLFWQLHNRLLQWDIAPTSCSPFRIKCSNVYTCYTMFLGDERWQMDRSLLAVSRLYWTIRATFPFTSRLWSKSASW